MAGIVLEINVDDKGTVKVKQFTDETKKAFDEMKRGPAEARGALDSFRDSWIGVTAKIGIATAAFYAAKRMIYDTAIEIASAGNEIERMARTLNMSTDDFQKWSYVAKMADVDAQGLGMSVQFLTRSIGEAIQGSGDASKAYTALGITLKDTTGKTKDQQTVLLETIDAFGKYEDGVNRDVLMMAVFGRSWMSVKPLIDQGTAAIKANMQEAERLSLILGKDVIKSLSESEDAFKKWSLTWKVARMEIFEPFVKDIRNLIEELLGLKRAWKEGGIKGIWEEIKEQSEKYKIEELTPSARVKEWVAGWTPAEIKKGEAPELPGGKNTLDQYFKDQQKYYESLSKNAEQLERLAYGGMENAALYKQIEDQKEMRRQLVETQALIRDFGWEDYAAGLDAANEGTRELTALTIANTEAAQQYRIIEEINRKAAGVRTDQAVQEIEKISASEREWISLSESISSAWNFNVSGMLRDTEDFGDAFKKTIDGMADTFISGVSKMITEWLLFESVQGGGKKFLGGGSGIGSIIGWIGNLLTMQEGGSFWATKPTLMAVGEGGEDELVNVTPKSKMGTIPIEGGGQTIVNMYITSVKAMDSKSFFDYVEENPAGIVSVVTKNLQGRGSIVPWVRRVT